MVFDILSIVALTLAASSLTASIITLRTSREVKHKHMLRGFAECEHCHGVITQHFIDGYGRVTCKSCKPEGFRDAVNRNIAKL